MCFHYTESTKGSETVERKAKHVLTREMIALAESLKTTDLYPQPVGVEYDKADYMLSDVGMNAKRMREYILAQTIDLTRSIHFCGRFQFDGSIVGDVFTRIGHPRFAEIKSQYYLKPAENLVCFEWQHSTANFAKVIDCGLRQHIYEIDRSLIRLAGNKDAVDLLKAMRYTCETLILWAHKCADACETEASVSDEPRKAELLQMADSLRWVPQNPARSFREAVQVLVMLFTCLPDSLGTLDRYLYRLYAQDIEKGVLTRDLAKEYVAELFITVNGFTSMHSGNADKGGESHFAIGGMLPDGNDGYNELSDLIVDTMMELPIVRPQVSVRIMKKTPYAVVRKALGCALTDKYMRFALIADEPRLKGMTEVGHIPLQDALNYTMVGCNEPALRGGIWFGGCTSNGVRCLTNMLYERTDEVCACETFDEVFALYEEEFEKDICKIIEYMNGFNTGRAKDRNVVSSIFIDGCTETGISVSEGGGRLACSGTNLMGFTSVIDSLSILKQLVFVEKRISMRDFIEIMRRNWEGDDGEELRAYILKKGRFFGNSDDLSDEVGRRVADAIWRHTKDKLDMFGNHLLIGTQQGYNPHNVWFGNGTPATPDGRRSGDAFMTGTGQTAGKDRNGFTALLKSVQQLDEHCVLTGPYVCNVYLDEALITKEDNLEKTAQIVYDYFMNGGLHMQINYVSKEELLKAKENPGDYPTLRVRVSGFSGHFVNLCESLQDDIIRRTLISGK